MGDLTRIVCLQTGDYCNRGLEYVTKLERGVRANLTVPFEFTCFTDDKRIYPSSIDKRPIPHEGLSGWWGKLSLFKPGTFSDGERIVYFDLDTLIVSNIDWLAGYSGRFAMIGQFFSNVNWIYAGNQSGVMAWQSGFGKEIWDAFEAQGFPNVRGGDQAFINSLKLGPDVFQEMFPDKLVSFKGSRGEKPEQACIVCFHGLPRPHQCGGWVRDYWK